MKKSKIPLKRESEIQKEILEYLKSKDILCFRVPLGPVLHGGVRKANPMRYFPDIVGVLPNTLGCMFTIECKMRGGKLSDGQKEMQERLEKNGVTTIVAYCLDIV